MSNFGFKLHTVYDNTVTAYVPQFWAYESLQILRERIMAAGLVHTDFRDEIASFGDTVNTRKPGNFAVRRKTDADDVTDQDAVATNVAVVLNQHAHVSFVIKDGEASKSFKDLRSEFLEPAMNAQAKFLDQVVLGQAPQFLATGCVGLLNTVTKDNINQYLVDARTLLNINKAPDTGRNLIWSPSTEGLALKNDLFISADKAADGGAAQREAYLGRKFGFQNYMSQLLGEPVLANTTIVTGAVNSASAIKSTTAVTVDGFTAAIGNNSFVSIGGDIHRVVSTTGGATPTVITVASPGLRYDAADNTVVTVVTPGAVNEAAGYAAGYSKFITVDTFPKMPIAGQYISFGTSASNALYTVVEVVGSTIMLDRPLEAAISDNDAINVSPLGKYNFAFHRNAIALVTRPLALPPAGTAQSGIANFEGLSMRAVITYDGKAQGTRVTLDMLCGVKVLDTALGCVFLA